MKMKIRWLLPLLLCMMLIVLSVHAAPNDPELMIGIAYPQAAMDEDTLFIKGVMLAKDEINKAGGLLGKTLDFVIRDDENDATKARQIAQTFCDMGVEGVIGHWSTNVCSVVEETYEINDIVMITPAATGMSLMRNDPKYVFRMIPSSDMYAQALAEHLLSLGIKNVAVYYSQDAYGIAFSQAVETELRHKGIHVIDRISAISTASLETVSDRWNAFGCDALVLAAVMPEATDVINLVRQMPTCYPIFGAENFDRLSLPKAVTSTEALYYVTLDKAKVDKAFVAAFTDAYGIAPDVFAIAGYEAVMLLADAVNATGTAELHSSVDFLKTLSEHETIGGSLTFDTKSHEFVGHFLAIYPLGGGI